MEIGLVGKLVIRCDGCCAQYNIDLDSLEEVCNTYERKMGAEVEYNFNGEYQCESCGNRMQYILRAYEYPVGALDYHDEESSGCEILESPEIIVKYYEYDFNTYEENEIRQEVNEACVNIEQILNDKNKIYQISPRDFEKLVAEVFSRQGYNVKITPATRDGGCDIIATKDINGIPYMILIECKRYSKERKAGVQLVRSLLGVQSDMRANKAILVTSSLFTKDAREFAERQNYLISLVDIDDLLNMMRDTLY